MPSPQRATSRQNVATGTPTTPTTLVARFTTRFKLRGELLEASGRKIQVEFDISLFPGPGGGAAQGVVRFVNDPGKSEELRVTGVWLNRTITFSPEKNSGTGRTPTSGQDIFVLELPSTDALEEITGYWSYGASRGTLTLKLVGPT